MTDYNQGYALHITRNRHNPISISNADNVEKHEQTVTRQGNHLLTRTKGGEGNDECFV